MEVPSLTYSFSQARNVSLLTIGTLADLSNALTNPAARNVLYHAAIGLAIATAGEFHVHETLSHLLA